MERALWSEVSVALQCVLYLLVCREEKAGDAVAELLRGKKLMAATVVLLGLCLSWHLGRWRKGTCVWRLVLFKDFILVCWC